MIAKLIVWGRDRDQALAHMSQALSEYQVVGLATNIAFLQRLVASRPFAQADLDTGLIERHHAALFPPPQPVLMPSLALAVAALLISERSAVCADPWADTSGWRMNGVLLRQLDFADDSQAYPVSIAYQKTGWRLLHGAAEAALTLVEHDGPQLVIKLDGGAVRGTVVRDGDVFHVFAAGSHAALNYQAALAHVDADETEGGRLTAPMPGKIVAVLVEKGKRVEKGTPLLIMEAMKMEHTITAPADGTVEALLYVVGDQVVEGVQLLAFNVTAQVKGTS
jgi:3-methylcrotonyl-CoA carboxylase alpha subunit